jgi:1-deoxy-D-xylulose-5-phosphate synthase
MAEAIEELKIQNSKFKIAHYDMRWLKPLDEEILHEVGKKYKTIVTAEDGMIAGGFGSAVLEWMSEHGYSPVIRRLGLPDEFVEHGKVSELQAIVGIDKDSIKRAIQELL